MRPGVFLETSPSADERTLALRLPLGLPTSAQAI